VEERGRGVEKRSVYAEGRGYLAEAELCLTVSCVRWEYWMKSVMDMMGSVPT
jgi:hypothetical protein